MITRIVKLTIAPDRVDEFKSIFIANHQNIEGFPGCNSVEVMTDTRFPNVFFTYSKWDNEESIGDYRNSELFQGIWKNAKKTFCAKPEAWSLLSVAD